MPQEVWISDHIFIQTLIEVYFKKMSELQRAPRDPPNPPKAPAPEPRRYQRQEKEAGVFDARQACIWISAGHVGRSHG